MHAKASPAGEFVLTCWSYGSASEAVYFAVGELVVSSLSSRISSEGAHDDDFWRWSSQIARGVADLHRIGIIHLALQV